MQLNKRITLGMCITIMCVQGCLAHDTNSSLKTDIPCRQRVQRCLQIADHIENAIFTEQTSQEDPYNFINEGCVDTIESCFHDKLVNGERPYTDMYDASIDLAKTIRTSHMHGYPSYVALKQEASQCPNFPRYQYNRKLAQMWDVIKNHSSQETVRHTASRVTDAERQLPQEEQRPREHKLPKASKPVDPSSAFGVIAYLLGLR